MRRRCVPVVVIACALLAAPALAGPAPGTWKGKLDRYTSTLRFQVKGNKLLKFTVPSAPGYCLTGFEAITVYVPSATIKGKTFRTTYHPPSQGDEKIVLSGRIAGSTAKGSVAATGPCHETFTWTARHA